MPSRQSSEITKEKMKDAFLTLYEQNSIEKISIRQLTDLAGVNRATFYSHYIDIYDLLKQIEDEKYEVVFGKLSVAIPYVVTGQGGGETLPGEAFFIENEKWLRVLVGTYGKSNIIGRIKEDVKRILREYTGIYEENDDPKMKYALEYIVSANAGIFTKWISNGMDIGIEDIKEIMIMSMQKGPMATIMSLRSEKQKP